MLSKFGITLSEKYKRLSWPLFKNWCGAFEKFIKRSLEFYKLDPSYYLNSSRLSWDAMLKMTEIKLELTLDIDNSYFLDQGFRGEISYICKRFREINNKYMKNYDPTK